MRRRRTKPTCMRQSREMLHSCLPFSDAPCAVQLAIKNRATLQNQWFESPAGLECKEFRREQRDDSALLTLTQAPPAERSTTPSCRSAAMIPPCPSPSPPAPDGQLVAAGTSNMVTLPTDSHQRLSVTEGGSQILGRARPAMRARTILNGTASPSMIEGTTSPANT